MNRFRVVEATLKAEFAKPFIYGKSDCFFFAVAVADALDSDLCLAREYAGTYRTQSGAVRALQKRGFGSLVDLFATHMIVVAPAMERLGDVAVVRSILGEGGGVCLGAKFATKTPQGRLDVGLADVVAAFRAGA